MQKELAALEKNNTRALVPLPPGKRAIGYKWVYKVKYRANGQIERYKGRLVAKGYSQVLGIDYHDIFSPVAKMVTARCLLAIAAAKGWYIEQLDVNNAFLRGDLSEEVYMSLPLGYKLSASTKNLVCRLMKSIYDLRQASREWFSKLASCLLSSGYKRSLSDTSLFTYSHNSIFLVVVIYVDDILIAGNDKTTIDSLKQLLDDKFSIKNLGGIKYYLGLEVTRNSLGIFVNQEKFITDLL